MAYKTCRVRNINSELKGTDGVNTYEGKELSFNESYKIPDEYRIQWAKSPAVLRAICNEELQVGDGETYFTAYSDQIDWLKDY